MWLRAQRVRYAVSNDVRAGAGRQLVSSDPDWTRRGLACKIMYMSLLIWVHLRWLWHQAYAKRSVRCAKGGGVWLLQSDPRLHGDNVKSTWFAHFEGIKYTYQNAQTHLRGIDTTHELKKSVLTSCLVSSLHETVSSHFIKDKPVLSLPTVLNIHN